AGHVGYQVEGLAELADRCETLLITLGFRHRGGGAEQLERLIEVPQLEAVDRGERDVSVDVPGLQIDRLFEVGDGFDRSTGVGNSVADEGQPGRAPQLENL